MDNRTLLILFTLIVIKLSQSTRLIGVQVMEMEDLVLLEASEEVGNLAYGDDCRQSGVVAITEDVCFHSNPMLQCVDGRCKCAFIKLGDGNEVEQMVFEKGKCKRPVNFQCTSPDDCVDGLTCTSTATSSNLKSNSLPGAQLRSAREQDHELNDDRLTSANVYRKRIKARVNLLANKATPEKQRNTNNTVDDKFRTNIGKTEEDDFMMDNDSDEGFRSAETNIKISMICVKADSSSMFEKSKLCGFSIVLLAIIHYLSHSFL